MQLGQVRTPSGRATLALAANNMGADRDSLRNFTDFLKICNLLKID
jgi:hypothetical protein